MSTQSLSHLEPKDAGRSYDGYYANLAKEKYEIADGIERRHAARVQNERREGRTRRSAKGFPAQQR